MKPSKRLIIFLFIAVLGISFTFYGYQMVFTPNVLVDREARELIIPDNVTFKSLQDQLYNGEYVRDIMAFSFLAKLMDYDENIRPGRYVLQANMSNYATIKLLRSGNQVPVDITFNNVRILPELAKKITRNLALTPQQFDSAVLTFAATNTYGFNQQNVMAMFIPNTYEVYYNVSGAQLLERLHEEYENFWTADRKAKAQQIGLTPIEVSILASIVQAETIKADEAPVIAGLYINRLKKGIPLQADPTLKFAVGDFSLKRILNVHKEVESPYNTYRHAGLPPGPINMPEISSLLAVLEYKPSNYYYMCAREDFSGYHNFSDNLAEHNRNAARYQRALTIEQRKAAQNLNR
ncbi:MAG: endolytic transglycosylase MltG [Bacteroidia bacterium]|nr:endolytic transglycosylase MltG [Bacteroidia bacterium]